MSGFNSYAGQLAVSVQADAANGQWSEGEGVILELPGPRGGHDL